MTERTFFENECAVIRFHDEGIIHHEFKGRAAGEPFREVLLAGLAELKRTKATAWLSDDRKHTVLGDGDEAWAQGTWFKAAAAAGWKYWAVVNPEKAVGQMQTSRHAKHFELGGIKVAMFSDVPSALEWLRAQLPAMSKAS